MSRNLDRNYHTLDELKDPDYWGVHIVKHFLMIIAVLFLILGVCVLITALLTEINITIKSNFVRTEKCEGKRTTCVQLSVLDKDFQKITKGDIAHIKVTSNKAFSRYIIKGRIIDILNLPDDQLHKTSHQLTVELDSHIYSPGELDVRSGFIIIDQQTIMNLFIDNFSRMLPDSNNKAH